MINLRESLQVSCTAAVDAGELPIAWALLGALLSLDARPKAVVTDADRLWESRMCHRLAAKVTEATGRHVPPMYVMQVAVTQSQSFQPLKKATPPAKGPRIFLPGTTPHEATLTRPPADARTCTKCGGTRELDGHGCPHCGATGREPVRGQTQ